MSFGLVLLVNAAVVAALMVGAWRVSLRLENAGVADVAWGLGFVLVAWTTWLLADGAPVRRDLLAALSTLWGLRLAVHVSARTFGHREDRRYVAMRRRLGPRFPRRSLYTVFLLRGALLWVVSLPVQIGQVPGSPEAVTAAGVLGIVVWTVGMFFETVGDWQLARFRREPANAGRAMDRGLWRYTRHPNHFGEFCVWWGIFLIAASAPAGWASAPGPLLLTFVLMRVSGVSLLDRSASERRRGRDDDVRRTNAFFPGPPSEERGPRLEWE